MVVKNHPSLNDFPVVNLCGIGRCSPDQAIRRWCLPGLWSLHCYNYNARLIVAGRDYEIHPGTVSLIPPETEMLYEWGGVVRHPFALFCIAYQSSRYACYSSAAATAPWFCDTDGRDSALVASSTATLTFRPPMAVGE